MTALISTIAIFIHKFSGFPQRVLFLDLNMELRIIIAELRAIKPKAIKLGIDISSGPNSITLPPVT